MLQPTRVQTRALLFTLLIIVLMAAALAGRVYFFGDPIDAPTLAAVAIVALVIIPALGWSRTRGDAR